MTQHEEATELVVHENRCKADLWIVRLLFHFDFIPTFFLLAFSRNEFSTILDCRKVFGSRPNHVFVCVYWTFLTFPYFIINPLNSSDCWMSVRKRFQNEQKRERERLWYIRWLKLWCQTHYTMCPHCAECIYGAFLRNSNGKRYCNCRRLKPRTMTARKKAQIKRSKRNKRKNVWRKTLALGQNCRWEFIAFCFLLASFRNYFGHQT